MTNYWAFDVRSIKDGLPDIRSIGLLESFLFFFPIRDIFDDWTLVTDFFEDDLGLEEFVTQSIGLSSLDPSKVHIQVASGCNCVAHFDFLIICYSFATFLNFLYSVIALLLLFEQRIQIVHKILANIQLDL